MAAKEKPDRFQRAERRNSGRHGSYAKKVSRDAAKREDDLLRTVLLELLICALVPPYGIYRICSSRQFELAFRVVGTVLAALVMFLWFSLIIPDGKPQTLPIPESTPRAVVEYSSQN